MAAYLLSYPSKVRIIKFDQIIHKNPNSIIIATYNQSHLIFIYNFTLLYIYRGKQHRLAWL